MDWYERHKIKLAEKETLEFLNEIKELGPIEENRDDEFDYTWVTDEYKRRGEFTGNYGWSVPNEKAIESIK